LAALTLALAGCTGSAHGPALPAGTALLAPDACPLASQRPLTVATLFFGRDIAGRGTVTDADWAAFAGAEVTPRFPDGFTATDGQGQWRDPAGRVTREPSKIVVIASEPTPDLGSRLTAVIDAYKVRFQQQSVGLLTSPACGAF
jgi:hypothetical protein